MVAAGLSRKGVGKLIFVTRTINSFSYLQTLELYKEDIEKLDQNFNKTMLHVMLVKNVQNI